MAAKWGRCLTILREIQKLSDTLPAWQQHTIAALYERQELRAGDLEDSLEIADDDVRIEVRSQRAAHLLDGAVHV
jgi:hypothetical protein